MKKAVSSRFLLPGIHCFGRDVCASATGIPYWWWKNLSKIWSGSSDWSTELLYCFSYCIVLAIVYEWHTEDIATKAKCKHNDLLQNSQHSRKIFFFIFRGSISVLLELIRNRTQNFTIIYQEKQNRTNLRLKPHDYWTTMTLIYVISMEFPLLRHRCPSWSNIPSGEEWGEMAVFAGFLRI